jgi:hypothetical protein
MSKTSIPLELQVILRDLSIAESESGRALAKVHKRAALAAVPGEGGLCWGATGFFNHGPGYP